MGVDVGISQGYRSRIGEQLILKSSLDADSSKFTIISALTLPNGFKLKTFDEITCFKIKENLLLKQKLLSLVDSVTNTETMHVCLHDLLPPNDFFRLNSFMIEDFVLDEH
ncbi:unnamed protein product [Rotaria sordida]|uniref:Uncharacterized protein n=1 Tax=Rotaria sordida TaxID=392033 RepID=A0A819P3Y8_9BILA|nr:unnamed protein product [Rotaria sordida]